MNSNASSDAKNDALAELDALLSQIPTLKCPNGKSKSDGHNIVLVYLEKQYSEIEDNTYPYINAHPSYDVDHARTYFLCDCDTEWSVPDEVKIEWL